MKKLICVIFAMFAALACSAGESTGYEREALCSGPPTPYGSVVGTVKGDWVDTITGNGSAIYVHTHNGASGNVGSGTASGFVCTGSFTPTMGLITSLAAGPLVSGGGKLHVVGASGSADINCASSDGTFSSATWTGSWLRSLGGITISGDALWQFNGQGGMLTSTELTNACQ